MNTIERKKLFEKIIEKIAKKEVIVSLEHILKAYSNTKNVEKITISAISYALKNLDIDLKKINAQNYINYMETTFKEKLNNIPNTEKFTINKLHKLLNFPKSSHVLKKILYDMNIRTKETKKTYLDIIKEELDYKNLTLKQLYKESGCKNKFISFQSKMYSTNLMFKDRKIINTPNRKNPKP